MEHFRHIIEKGRVNLMTNSGGIITLSTRIIMIAVCLYVLYKMNFSNNENLEDQPIPFLNLLFTISTIVCIYLLILSLQKLKTKFYKDVSSTERKDSAIQKVATRNKWKLKSKEKNYYFFWENNYIFQSYYITIVFDEQGFYVNSYPFLDRIIDFAASQQNSDAIFEQLKGCL